MASYSQWNESITDYFSASIPKGRPVFLALNDPALIEIGVNYHQLNPDECIEKFEDCLRETFTNNGRVTFHHHLNDNEDSPYHTAFLAGMVLASHRMSKDEETDERAYFKRLTKLLLNEDMDGRPEGLETGLEERFWKEWNDWLSQEGWEITAKKGLGSHKFTQLPISQSLLRDGDIDHLANLFLRHLINEQGNRSLNENGLKSWILNNTGSGKLINRKHLQDGFLSNDITRSSAFFGEAFQLFEILLSQSTDFQVTEISRIRINKSVRCGILRAASRVSDEISYQILPKKPKGWKDRVLSFKDKNGAINQLKPYKRGYFEPLSNIKPFIKEKLEIPIIEDDPIEKIVLQKRNFWVLTKDPSDLNGHFASWNDFDNPLGTKMIVLIKNHKGVMHDEMETYKEQGLIKWHGEPIKRKEGENQWMEYSNCMVLKNCWDGVIPSPEAQDLYHRLRPALMQYSSINLSGGLMVPEQNAWLVGHHPKFKLFGFEKTFDIELQKDTETIGTKEVNTQEEYALDSISNEKLSAGIYKIIVRSNDYLDETNFNLIEWSDLKLNQSDFQIENYPSKEGSKFKTVGPLTICMEEEEHGA